jgi:hypothetical protein
VEVRLGEGDWLDWLGEHKLNLVYFSLLSLNEPVYHSKLQFPYLPMLGKAGTNTLA